MKNICAVCGRELSGYFATNINGKEYMLCEKCNTKIKSGKLSVSDLSLNTVEDIEQSIKKEDERIERKIIAQQNDPLYDDIHQIAGDLRFLKNLVIIGLVIYLVLSILSILF